MLKRRDVIAHFTQIFRAALGSRASLRGEQFTQRRLRALDAAGIDRFATDKRSNQHMRIRESPSLAGEAPKQAIRLRKDADQLRRPRDHWRQRGGLEGAVAG